MHSAKRPKTQFKREFLKSEDAGKKIIWSYYARGQRLSLLLQTFILLIFMNYFSDVFIAGKFKWQLHLQVLLSLDFATIFILAKLLCLLFTLATPRSPPVFNNPSCFKIIILKYILSQRKRLLKDNCIVIIRLELCFYMYLYDYYFLPT